MPRLRGLQAEILLSLAVVMATATGLLAATLARSHADAAEELAALAARALVADARSPLFESEPGPGAARWWTVDAGSAVRPRGDHGEALDADSLALARRARAEGAPLVSAGAAWQPVRVAVPVGSRGEVAVARLPAAARPGPVLALVLGDILLFTAFGALLLRRRLVRPLERLAHAARAIEQGDSVRAPLDGPKETIELGAAFNAMTDALARRSAALEKAIADLRASNQRLREAREGLDRAERLASVGRLAAGVAHEVGNPMGALLAFMDLAQKDPSLSERGRGLLERGAREGERVRAILRQLLDFSRPPRRARRPFDLARLAEEAAGLVRAQRRYGGIAIDVRAEGDAPAALGDPDAVMQIVLNLLLNAADALRGCEGPRIEVRVREAALRWRAGEGPAPAARRRRADAVECVVRDNGPGVAEEDRERIFDPFFTTKPPGEGTGLGLSNAARFAEELGGSLALEREGGAPGAVFVLRLPADPAVGDGTPRGDGAAQAPA